MQPLEILIAIQARSNSTRFPKKIYKMIGDRRVLDHVIDRAKSTSDHITRYMNKAKAKCQVAVLHPNDDHELISAFGSSGAILIGGPEEDVLTRYVDAQRLTDCDYIVRLTSDCPLMLDFVIAKHINVAIFNSHDYVSDIDEDCRFVADGFDCEVLSRKAIKWLERNATSRLDREHVTTALRREMPSDLSFGFVSMKIDTSHMKMSVDTPEDLERMRKYYEQRQFKMGLAKRKYGSAVYEL